MGNPFKSGATPFSETFNPRLMKVSYPIEAAFTLRAKNLHKNRRRQHREGSTNRLGSSETLSLSLSKL